MATRARFFDDYRLSRIEEEADRLSLHSDISCSVDMATAAAICPSNTFSAQRSASADGTLESTADDDDDDDYELPLPPPHLTYIEHTAAKTLLTEKSLPTSSAEVYGVGTAGEDMSLAALRALHFMQAKYDSLGKVKVEKPLSGMMTSSSTTNPPTVNTTSPGDRSKSSMSPDCAVEAMSPLLTVIGSGARSDATNCFKSAGVAMSKPEICFKLQTSCSRCTSHGQCCRTTSATMTDRSVHVCAPHGDHVTRLRQSMQGCDHSGKCCDTSISMVQSDPLRTAKCCASNDQSGTAVGGHTSPCGGAKRQQHHSMTLQQHQHQHQQRHVADSSSSHHHHHHQQHGTQSPASSNTGSGASTQRRVLPLTTAELFQVDLFYRSFKTIVHVSTSTATLYTGSTSTATEPQHSSRSYHGNHQQQQQQHLSKTDWKSAASGIPVIVLDQRSQPSRLHVILAERGTGFELWRQAIEKTDQYSAMSVNDEPVFHVVNCPPENEAQRGGGGVCARKMGLHFDDPLAATEFHRQLLRLADYDRLALHGGGRIGKKKLGKKGGKGKRAVSFSKADISQPCCFTHVTRLERDNGTNTLVSRQSENTNIPTNRRH